MNKFGLMVVEFLKAEDGPTAVEYAVMLALIIVVCLVAITALGTSANATFGTVGTKIADRPDLQARQAGTQFINDLCAGLTQSAWDQTTADFQSRHIKVGGPDQSKYFADILQEHP